LIFRRGARWSCAARHGLDQQSAGLAGWAGNFATRRQRADAAVAAAAVLNVTESASTGIGGDMFALTFDAKTKQVTALNGSGRSPAALTLKFMRDQGHSEMPLLSPHSITVPGAGAGWEDLLKRHGTMTLADVLQDAIHYARDGFPVHPIYGAAWLRYEEIHERCRSRRLHPRWTPTADWAGRSLPGLAEALQAIADGGSAGFYSGKIAEAIVKAVQKRGGLMTMDDLQNHRSTWETRSRPSIAACASTNVRPMGKGSPRFRRSTSPRRLISPHCPGTRRSACI